MRREYGFSLIEVMASLAVLVIGMMAVFKVATVVSNVNVRTRQMYDALTKTQNILEALKEVPTQTLICLASGSAPAGCLGTCLAAGGDDYHCRMALGLLPGQNSDGRGTTFEFLYTVRTVPAYPNMFDIQVSTRWMGQEERPRYHYITLRTREYRQ